jgi:hypothetical protein
LEDPSLAPKLLRRLNEIGYEFGLAEKGTLRKDITSVEGVKYFVTIPIILMQDNKNRHINYCLIKASQNYNNFTILS